MYLDRIWFLFDAFPSVPVPHFIIMRAFPLMMKMADGGRWFFCSDSSFGTHVVHLLLYHDRKE